MAKYSPSHLFYSCAFVLLLHFLTCPSSKVDGLSASHDHVVALQSDLLSQEICPPPKVSVPSRLQLFHRNSPCSSLESNQKLTPDEILKNDQLRVNWLHKKTRTRSVNSKSAQSSLTATKIPARRGNYIGTGNYVVTVAFGTPKVNQTVVFDTGSDVTWIQCQPCVSSCYQQAEKFFNPSRSSTYANISCSSPYCTSLDRYGCLGGTCIYDVKYGDNSETAGFFAWDTLTLSPADVIPSFRFGCGEENTGLFGRAAGLMGLARGAASIVSQTYKKYAGVFSYCLPADTVSTGYLTFGRSMVPSNVQYTPMLTNSYMPSFYFLELISISVGGKKLAISPTYFSYAGTIIDSGTVITRLPPTAYTVLRSAFAKGMTNYPIAPAGGILDTCYDFSKNQTVTIPSVTLNFRGASAELDFFGIIYVVSGTQACLGFAPNGDDSDLVIIGNTQQRRFNVVYDVGKGLIGFGPNGC